MIIAELGINHGGSMELAIKMIVSAHENGADLIKLQLYDADRLARSPEAYKVLKQAELSFEDAGELFCFGHNIGAEVFFSVFDVERVRWCEEMGVKRYKIAATMRDQALFDAVYATGKPLITSKREPGYVPGQDWLYCPEGYPQTNMHMPLFYGDDWDGFSDHTIGLDAAKIALARGAQIVEKHFSLDHHTGADAEWSMTPDELWELVRWQKICQTILS